MVFHPVVAVLAPVMMRFDAEGDGKFPDVVSDARHTASSGDYGQHATTSKTAGGVIVVDDVLRHRRHKLLLRHLGMH